MTKLIKVVVNHTGACKSEETGRIHNYVAGKEIKLPEDVLTALGDNATVAGSTPTNAEAKQVISAPKNKMVAKAEVSK